MGKCSEQKKNGKCPPYKEVVMKVYMHCEGCASKVSNCLKGLDGIEQIKTEIEGNKVIVLGKFDDPLKILKRVQKKFSRNAELISPKPNPKQEKKEPPKKEPPQIKVAMLRMYMHCEGCVRDIERVIQRMAGVLTVEPDMAKSTVVVRGVIDPPKLVATIVKRMGKHTELLSQRLETDDKNANAKNNPQEDKNHLFFYPPQYCVNHIYPSQIFSDENVHSCSIM